METFAHRWFERLGACGAASMGIISTGYIATHCVMDRLWEPRPRLDAGSTSKQEIKRRFGHFQEDWRTTVSELLPSVIENIHIALPVELITQELQRKKHAKNNGTPRKQNNEDDRMPTTTETPLSSTDEDESAHSIASTGSGKPLVSNFSNQSSLESLNSVDTPPRSRTQLWQDLKIDSLTRCITGIYTISILSLFTRIQLNLLGRRGYLSSIGLATSGQPASLKDSGFESLLHRAQTSEQDDFSTSQAYLSQSRWFLQHGWHNIMRVVRNAVKLVFESISPNENITIDELKSLLWRVSTIIEEEDQQNGLSCKWLSMLLPAHVENGMKRGDLSTIDQGLNNIATGTTIAPKNDHALDALLDETMDLIESPTFSYVLHCIVTSAFKHMEKKIMDDIISRAGGSGHDGKMTIKVASLLAFASRETQSMSSIDRNGYLHSINSVAELDEFAAIIFCRPP